MGPKLGVGVKDRRVVSVLRFPWRVSFELSYPHMKPVRLAELDRPSVRVHDSAVLSHVHILNTWWKMIMLVCVKTSLCTLRTFPFVGFNM